MAGMFADQNRQRALDLLLDRKLTRNHTVARWPTAGTTIPLSPGQGEAILQFNRCSMSTPLGVPPAGSRDGIPLG
jgi:hypothetical protein